MIKILDYGLGNIKAFINAYNRIGVEANAIENLIDINPSDKLILPGVGHFDDAIRKLSNKFDLNELNRLILDEKMPIMGVCVGMQIMCNNSEEGNLNGLGWFNCSVKKLPFKENIILPHMGWNKINLCKKSLLFKGLEDQENYMYYLHSYYCDLKDKSTFATTKYSKDFSSIAISNNIYGIQGHPEKSHLVGETLLKNFSEL